MNEIFFGKGWPKVARYLGNRHYTDNYYSNDQTLVDNLIHTHLINKITTHTRLKLQSSRQYSEQAHTNNRKSSSYTRTKPIYRRRYLQKFPSTWTIPTSSLVYSSPARSEQREQLTPLSQTTVSRFSSLPRKYIRDIR